MTALTNLTFSKLSLKVLTLGVFDFNTSAKACYNSIGFKQFDLKANARQFDGESWDLVLMQLDENDWQ